RPGEDPELSAARKAIMNTGPVPVILDAQAPEGFWVKPGPGYAPKYRGTLWSVLFLAQLGCDGGEERVQRAVEYVFDHAQTKNGAFAMSGTPGTAIHCLWGNMVRALLDLGAWGDERLKKAVDWLARSVTGDGFRPYLKGGVQAPGFVCSANYGLPCGWGAVRVLWGLNAVPSEYRTPMVNAAINMCIEFLLGYDIARADYPYKDRINSSWFKFGYPLGYVTDVLLNLDVLTEAGVVDDPQLDDAVELVLSKRGGDGRWPLDYSYSGKLWVDIEEKRKPSKWVTLRALRVLKRLGMDVT
ncbi:MAG: nitrogen fixation protein NifH, partial [Anaerolineae bacterium]|nr:nitrogen fixation protein NifH [Anaerolineae bacterium]